MMNAGAPFKKSGEKILLGIVGCGNMGGAIARGVLAHDELRAAFSLLVYDPGEKATQAMREAGINVASSATELAREADIVLLAVKPQYVGAVLRDIAPGISGAGDGKILLSIAAGVTLETLRQGVGSACPVVRVMPNILVEVSQGIFALCFDSQGADIAPAAKDAVRRLLGGLGSVVELDESRMNAFTALAGSGPAYIYYFIDALAEAGVSVGLSRESSLEIALGLVRGSAALMSSRGLHPAILREQVSSPGGTTIAALNHLDRKGVRGHVIDAVSAACRRGQEMEKES